MIKELKLRARATFHGQDSPFLGEILQEKRDDVESLFDRLTRRQTHERHCEN